MEFGQNRYSGKQNNSHYTKKKPSHGPRKLVKIDGRLYIAKNIHLLTTEHLIPDLVESEVMQNGFHVTYRVQQNDEASTY